MSDMEAGKNVNTDNRPAASGRIVVMAGKSHRRRNIMLIIAAAVIVVAGGLTAWYLLAGPGKTSKVAFTIDGQDYTKDQVNSLIQYPTSKGLSRDDAAKRAFDMYKHRKAADKVGIVVSDQQLADSRKKNFPGLSGSLDANAEAWVNLVSYDNVLTELSATSPIYSNASGYIYMFWFNRHITYNSDKPVDGVGDSKLIAADRQYASDRANYYRQQLIDQKMTPDQALQAIKADERLGYTPGMADNQSLRFTEISSSDQYDSVLRNIPSEVQQRVVKIGPKTGVDEIQTGSITISDADNPASGILEGEGANPHSTEAYLYLVDIDKAATRSYNMSDYTSALNNLSSNYRGIE